MFIFLFLLSLTHCSPPEAPSPGHHSSTSSVPPSPSSFNPPASSLEEAAASGDWTQITQYLETHPVSEEEAKAVAKKSRQQAYFLGDPRHNLELERVLWKKTPYDFRSLSFEKILAALEKPALPATTPPQGQFSVTQIQEIEALLPSLRNHLGELEKLDYKNRVPHLVSALFPSFAKKIFRWKAKETLQDGTPLLFKLLPCSVPQDQALAANLVNHQKISSQHLESEYQKYTYLKIPKLYATTLTAAWCLHVVERLPVIGEGTQSYQEAVYEFLYERSEKNALLKKNLSTMMNQLIKFVRWSRTQGVPFDDYKYDNVPLFVTAEGIAGIALVDLEVGPRRSLETENILAPSLNASSPLRQKYKLRKKILAFHKRRGVLTGEERLLQEHDPTTQNLPSLSSIETCQKFLQHSPEANHRFETMFLPDLLKAISYDQLSHRVSDSSLFLIEKRTNSTFTFLEIHAMPLFERHFPKESHPKSYWQEWWKKLPGKDPQTQLLKCLEDWGVFYHEALENQLVF